MTMLSNKITYTMLIYSNEVLYEYSTESETKFIQSNYFFTLINANSSNTTDMVALILKRKPDIIISDIFRPGYDILYLLSKINKIENYDPIIIAIGNLTNTSMINIILDRGCDYYMQCPVDMDALSTVALMLKGVVGFEKKSSSVTYLNHTGNSSEVIINDDLYSKIDNILSDDFGIPHNLRGYKYITDAIIYIMENGGVFFNIHLSKELYPAIAEKYNTTYSAVERNIRHAIEKAFQKAIPVEILYKYFGNSYNAYDEKPTNTLFISTVCDKIISDSRSTRHI